MAKINMSSAKVPHMIYNLGGGRGPQMVAPQSAPEAPSAERSPVDARVQREARERATSQPPRPLEPVPTGDKKRPDSGELNNVKQAGPGGALDLEQLMAMVQAMMQKAGGGGAAGGGGGCNGSGGGGGGCNGGGGGCDQSPETDSTNKPFDSSFGTDAAEVTSDTTPPNNEGGEQVQPNSAASTQVASASAVADFVSLKEKKLEAAEKAVPRGDPIRQLSDAALEAKSPSTAVAHELQRRAARASLDAATARADLVKAVDAKGDAASGGSLTRDEKRELSMAGNRATELQKEADRRAALANTARTAAENTTTANAA